MRRPALLLVALLALLPLAACGDDAKEVDTTEDPGTDPAGMNDPLQGRELTVTEATGHEIVAGTTITIGFDGGQVTVAAGCNHLSGDYRLEDAALVVEALGGTEMGCDPERMEQDAWIGAFLAERPTVTSSEGAATLTAGATVLTLSDAPATPPADLVGPTWTLDTLIAGDDPDDSAASVPAGVTASITFAEDGTYQVSAGCNTGRGTYEPPDAEGTMTVEAPAITRMRCDDAAMEVETTVLGVLDGEVTATIEGDRLTLTGADGAGLGFTAG